FFCAGRRRHTRFSRDWSSDVCSSDLCATRMRAAASGDSPRWVPRGDRIAAGPAGGEGTAAVAGGLWRRGLRGRGAHVHLPGAARSEEHTSELQSRENLVCRLLLEKKK